MISINRATILGHVGQSPEVRDVGSARVANLRVATNEKWRDKESGETMERTEWHNVTVWTPRLVKLIEQFVRKGTPVYIEGNLNTRKWKDQAGNDRFTTDIVVRGFDGQIILLDGKRPDSGGGYDKPGSDVGNTPEDEIPF